MDEHMTGLQSPERSLASRFCPGAPTFRPEVSLSDYPPGLGLDSLAVDASFCLHNQPVYTGNT